MTTPLRIFQGYGVELEYMLVDRDTLDVRPISDSILYKIAGAYESEVPRNGLSWSNELVLHVIELKTNGPAPDFDELAPAFQKDICEINALAEEFNAILLPTAMHPWMDPHTETQLWPHEYSPVYESFNRIFSCKGHGWSNLQSTHINLPFGDDEEFGRLHAAIRLVLPLLPALAASSPLAEGKLSDDLDARLTYYRNNARRVPLVSGHVVPEPVFSRAEYEVGILDPLYRAIAPYDPEGILRYEWLNARGAIARFDRDAIEIRVLDVQECVQADLAILRLIVEALKGLVAERWATYEQQRSWPAETLRDVLLAVIRHADGADLSPWPEFSRVFGGDPSDHRTAGDLWRHLFASVFDEAARGVPDVAPLKVIFSEGCLARRIRHAVGPEPSRVRLVEVYRSLADCLHEGRMFHGAV